MFGNCRSLDKSLNLFFVEGKSLLTKGRELFQLLSRVINDSNVGNREKIKEIYRDLRSSFEQMLISRPIGIVLKLATSRLSSLRAKENYIEGLEQLRFLRRKDIDGIEELSDDLSRLRDKLFSTSEKVFNLTLDEKNINSIKADIHGFIRRLNEKGNSAKDFCPVMKTVFPNQALIVPVQVSYTALAYDLSEIQELPGSVDVLLTYIQDSYLWHKIRVEGGAYGAGCAYDREAKIMIFYSWDDPNPKRTMSIFNEIGNYISSVEASNEEITRSIIGTIGRLDQPLCPQSKGEVRRNWHLLGITDEYRKERRLEILNTSLDEIRSFGRVLDPSKTRVSRAVVGPRELLDVLEDFQLEDI